MHLYVCQGGCFRFPDQELKELYGSTSTYLQHRSLVLNFTKTNETSSLNDQGFRVFVAHRVTLPFEV